MGEGIERLFPFSRSGDSMLWARLQAVLREEFRGALPRFLRRPAGPDYGGQVRGRRSSPPRRLLSRSVYATEPGTYVGRMLPGASLTIGLVSEATLHGWRPLLTSRGRQRSMGGQTEFHLPGCTMWYSVYHTVQRARQFITA